MNPLIDELKAAIAALAQAKGLRDAVVMHRVNKYGEVVIALILPARK